MHPLRNHLIDSVLVGTEAERTARQVRVLPGVFGGLQQSRDECRLELGDSDRLRFEFHDVRLDAAGPGVAVGLLPCRVFDPRAPEHREQIARRLRRGADRAGPRGYVVPAGELLARLHFRHFRLLPAEHLGQPGSVAEARRDPERLQGLSEPPALALVSRCRHFASVWP